MSLSPSAAQPLELASYETGWVAIHRLLREGQSWSGREQHCSYLNTGDGRFANVSALTGLDLPDDGRAAARVDWDLDGRTDLWIAGRNSPRVRLFLNRTASANASVELRLVGTRCNRDALGAQVEVVLADGQRHVQTLRAGEGYLAQSSKWLHFGLGDATKVEKVVVRWPAPDSSSEEFTGVQVRARSVLVQGSGAAERWAAPGAPAAPEAPEAPGAPGTLATAPTPPLAATERARIVLAARVALPPLPLSLDNGQAADGRDGIEAPLLVTLWSSTCPPCLAELGELSRRADELRAAGLNVLALSVDDESRRADALDVLRRVQWDLHAGFASLAAIESLDVLQRSVTDRQRRMPVPTSFLVDAERKVAVIYKGPVAVETLLADAGRLRARPGEVRDAAVPFPGLWLGALPTPDLGALDRAYVERGLQAAADDLARARVVARGDRRAIVLNEMGMARARQGRLDEAIATFREAVALEPEFVGALVNLASALHETLRIAEAIGLYEQALRLEPRHVTAIYNLGLARCALGRFEEARAELVQLDLLQPEAAAKLREQMQLFQARKAAGEQR